MITACIIFYESLSTFLKAIKNGHGKVTILMRLKVRICNLILNRFIAGVLTRHVWIGKFFRKNAIKAAYFLQFFINKPFFKAKFLKSACIQALEAPA